MKFNVGDIVFPVKDRIEDWPNTPIQKNPLKEISVSGARVLKVIPYSPIELPSGPAEHCVMTIEGVTPTWISSYWFDPDIPRHYWKLQKVHKAATKATKATKVTPIDSSIAFKATTPPIPKSFFPQKTSEVSSVNVNNLHVRRFRDA
jgi:hypothetical protein